MNQEVSSRSRETTATKCTKSVMHVKSRCFADLNLLLLAVFVPSPSGRILWFFDVGKNTFTLITL